MKSLAGSWNWNWISPLLVALAAVLLAGGMVWKNTTTTTDNNRSSSSSNHNDNNPTTEMTIWVMTPDSEGLRMDAAILERYLGGSSQTVLLSQDEPPPPLVMLTHQQQQEDCVLLYLEVSPQSSRYNVREGWKNLYDPSAASNCRLAIMVNTDQFSAEMLQTPGLDLFLCKTRQCVTWIQHARRAHYEEQQQQQQPEEATNALEGASTPPPRQQQQQRDAVVVPIVYTGFTSKSPLESLYLLDDDDDDDDDDATILSNLDRFDRFLHVAGRSPHKGTLHILLAWIRHPDWPKLTVTSYNNAAVDAILANLGLSPDTNNIRHISTKKLSRTDVAELMVRHGVHLCLSGMEGFGHSMNEARAVGALVMATDYPAMNEMMIDKNEGVLIAPTNLLEWHNGLPYAHVDADAIARVMTNTILPMSLEDRAAIGRRARRAFYRDQAEFAARMQKVECYLRRCHHHADNASAEAKAAVGEEDPLRACAEQQCELQLE